MIFEGCSPRPNGAAKSLPRLIAVPPPLAKSRKSAVRVLNGCGVAAAEASLQICSITGGAIGGSEGVMEPSPVPLSTRV